MKKILSDILKQTGVPIVMILVTVAMILVLCLGLGCGIRYLMKNADNKVDGSINCIYIPEGKQECTFNGYPLNNVQAIKIEGGYMIFAEEAK